MQSPPPAIKAILFDIDGVIIPEGDVYFSTRLAQKIGVAPEHILPFFVDEFYDCLRGTLDLKQEIKKYLHLWHWDGNVDNVLSYWFEAENETDPVMLQWIQQLRSTWIDCYIASNQEKYRADFLMNKVGLSNYFDDTFFSYQIGHLKDTPAFFTYILTMLNIPAEHILFIDDIQEYVDNAKEIGIQAVRYSDTMQLKHDLDQLGYTDLALMI